jgi:hypothetical protein
MRSNARLRVARVQIRVIAAAEAAVRHFDRVGVGVRGDAEHCVVIPGQHG